MLAAIGLEGFLGRPRGFFSTFSSPETISSPPDFSSSIFFSVEGLLLAFEILDFPFDVFFPALSLSGWLLVPSSVNSGSLTSVFSKSVLLSFSLNKSSSVISSETSPSSFLRIASEYARSSAINASRSATGI